MTTHITQLRTQASDERRRLVADAVAAARAAYHPLHLPPTASEIDHMQDALYARAIPCTSHNMALALIAHLGATFAQEFAEQAIESLGLVLAHAAVLASMERMTFEPIIGLAQDFRRRQDVEPIQASGAVAAATAFRSPLAIDRAAPLSAEAQRLAIADALALALAKAIDDVEIGHSITVHPVELLLVIGREILAGGRRVTPRDGVAIPPPLPPPPDGQRNAAVWDVPRVDTDATTQGIIEINPRHAMSLHSPAMAEWERLRQATADLDDASMHERGDFTVTDTMATRTEVRDQPADAMTAVMEREITAANAFYDAKEKALLEHGYGIGLPPGVPMIGLGDAVAMLSVNSPGCPVPGLADKAICPMCAAPMSRVDDSDVWRCKNGHDHTTQALKALGLRFARADETTRPLRRRK